MAAERAQETSYYSCPSTYHVFLSFRGADTRKIFTDHLYTALVDAGFRTFRDGDEIERGENIKSELEKAIQLSRSSIIVLSKNYASSSWCLDELVLILEHKRNKGHAILPVFYHVDPSHVQKQTGSFAKALARHEKRFQAESDEIQKKCLDKVEGWRAALREVVDLGGMVFKNRDNRNEFKFIQKIVNVIGDKVNRTILSIAPYLIGINSRVQNINYWLQTRSTDVSIMVIYGIGGIGKTTIAKFVFNLNFEKFEGSSFLENIRERSEQDNGLVHLQRELLSDVLKCRKVMIQSVDEGTSKIMSALSHRRVLLVLDDVDHIDQLDAILGLRDWFYPRSKIIITTRNLELLKAHKVDKNYNVEKLNEDESFELFSLYAFGQDHSTAEYLEVSKRIVQHCGGLPLALQILGSSLSGKNLDVWESALKKLEAIPNSQLVRKLRISYDSLHDDHDRNLFLEVACFFIGRKKDNMITILDECDFYTAVGIQNLVDRCLITVDKNNKLWMHQLLRDLGREIVRGESLKEPGKRTRLWHYKDSYNVLREETGTEKIEGLNLNLPLLEEPELAKTSFSLNDERKRESNDFNDDTMFYGSDSAKRRRLDFLSWLPSSYVWTKRISKSNIDIRAFSRMQKLRLLLLNNVQLIGGYKDFPKKLKWLCWRGFNSKSIPNDFPLESLVSLDLRHSSLEQYWKGTKLLRLLKILNLSHSPGLVNTPNFSEIPNIERLILKHCINLVEVHESIGESKRLVLLNLEGCINLRKLPNNISELNTLEKLILSDCSKLEEFSIELGKMQSLSVFHADRTLINQLNSSAGEEESRCSRSWSWMSKLRRSPHPTSFALASLSASLVSLSLENCNLSDDAIPRDIGILTLLQDLNLSGNPIRSLPAGIKGLTMLQSLNLKFCRQLQSLPELPGSLVDLDFHKCSSLEKLTNLPNLSSSLELIILQCAKLCTVSELFKLEPIRYFEAEMTIMLGVFDIKCLEKLEVSLYNNLTLTRREYPVQGLYEFGIFSTFLPGNIILDWFNNVSTSCSMRFKVPSHPDLMNKALNVRVVYESSATHAKNSRHKFWNEFYIRITNKTKNLKWIYSPTFNGIPDSGKDLTWLSHWKMGNQLECDDELIVSVFPFSDVQVIEFGVHIVYEQEDGVDLSAYLAEKGSYFLCHHDFDIQQSCSVDDGWNTKGWYEFLFGDSKESTGEGVVLQ